MKLARSLAVLLLFLTSASAWASWDVFAQDFPKVARLSQVPEDFKPRPLGKRGVIERRIAKVVPSARFDQEGWANVEGPDMDIEIVLGREDDVESIAFHGRGGAGDVDVVDRILRELGVRAIDVQTGEFFSKPEALRSHRKWRWRSYADRIGK